MSCEGAKGVKMLENYSVLRQGVKFTLSQILTLNDAFWLTFYRFSSGFRLCVPRRMYYQPSNNSLENCTGKGGG